MAQYAFHLGATNLSIFDTPVGYSPPRGPASYFEATYNHRESTQPALFTYSNLGTRWTFDWLSFIEDDPTDLDKPVDLYVRGGGREAYDGFVNEVSKPQQDVRAVLTRTHTNPIVYERESPDGSVEVYSQPDGGMSPRRVFLTEWRDPQGNKLTFTYDTQFRMTSVQDAIGQVTTLSYELAADPLKITKVTDPFGRSATFEYDSTGRLVKITDVIGIRSEFEYGAEDFILAMTTPYGRTTFRKGSGPYLDAKNNWVEATDPLGGTERVETLVNPGSAPLGPTDPPNTVPAGFTDNSALNTHLSVYYSKLAMARATADPPDPNDGEITKWRSSPTKLSGYQVHSTKLPRENRVWYEQQGQLSASGIAPEGRPSKIGRVLDDGSSQIHRYEYGSRGNVTKSIDPVGRETVYEYAANETDLLRVKQRNGTGYELLQEMTYDAAHQPLTMKDASGKTTSYTYNSEGQILTITTPQRAGITENRTTRYVYDANGYLQSVTGPQTGATTRYTYDGVGRTRTVIDSEEYSLTFDYDVLDRQVKTTYPDGTFEETAYDRLDPSWSRDRLGRWTHRVYDALRRVSSTSDPLGRTVSQVWCSCGSLDALIDANGNRTEWERDLQGRVTKEIRANGSEWLYEYETTTSRLERVTDANGQHKDYEYFLDDNLQSVSYPNPLLPTPNVSFTYDTAYN
ncbi:MAG: RHS repeat protein, partial [Vicinamibacteria bacterium]